MSKDETKSGKTPAEELAELREQVKAIIEHVRWCEDAINVLFTNQQMTLEGFKSALEPEDGKQTAMQ